MTFERILAVALVALAAGAGFAAHESWFTYYLMLLGFVSGMSAKLLWDEGDY